VAIPGGLTRGWAKSQKKVSVTQTSVTGTGAVTSGLASVDAGGAQATPQNAATTITTQSASVTSISGGTINVVVVDQQAAANVLGASAKNIGVVAVGQ
jgi:hypothetical protein